MAFKPVISGDLGRYLAALFGSAGSSGAQFLLTLVLLKLTPAEPFAEFAFLWLVAQFVWALGGALFAAPLARVAAGEATQSSVDTIHAIGWMQLGFAIAAMAFGFLLAHAVGNDPAASRSYALLTLFGALRLYARVAAYAHNRQKMVVIADSIFACGVALPTAMLYFSGTPTPKLAYEILLFGNCLGLVPLLRSVGLHLGHFRPRAILSDARSFWSRYSLWSLIGVISTETTANAHSYIVTLVLGASAFGPIAASAVLIRPGMVALNALVEFERARMARLLAASRPRELRRARRLFRAVGFALWASTAILTYLILRYGRERLFSENYAPDAIIIGGVLWTILLLIRIIYFPEAAEMQASGDFAALAWPKIWSAPLSIAGVVLLLLFAQPVWSLAAICCGEAYSAILLLRAQRRVEAARVLAACR